jgi:hypothetical protein
MKRQASSQLCCPLLVGILTGTLVYIARVQILNRNNKHTEFLKTESKSSPRGLRSSSQSVKASYYLIFSKCVALVAKT